MQVKEIRRKLRGKVPVSRVSLDILPVCTSEEILTHDTKKKKVKDIKSIIGDYVRLYGADFKRHIKATYRLVVVSLHHKKTGRFLGVALIMPNTGRYGVVVRGEENIYYYVNKK